MKIGFDARVVGWPGLGTYSRNLLKHFAIVPDLEILCFYNEDVGHLIPRSENIELVPLNEDLFSTRNHKRIGATVNKAGCDLFHTPHVVAPTGLDCPLLVTAHDLIPLLYPKTMSIRHRRTSRRLLVEAIRKADHIITASRTTCDQLKNHFRIEDQYISLVPDGVDRSIFFRRDDSETDVLLKKYRIKPPHILWLGTCMPHKNVEALIDAFAMLPESLLSQYQLTLAGKQMGRYWQKICEKIVRMDLQEKISRPGFIDDADVPALFSSAEVFCFPSLYEGFGLPPLEAMACGTPVLCSNLTSLPEVVGNAGVLSGPDAGSINTGMIRILSDPDLQKELSEKGLERSRIYTWEKTAARTLEVYGELLGRGGRRIVE